MSIVDDTRERALDAVASLIEEGGRKNVTQGSLATRAGIGIPKLREYFDFTAESNEKPRDRIVHNAIHAALERELRALHQTVPWPPTGDLRKDLIQLVTRYQKYYVNNKFLMYLYGDLVHDEKFQETFQALQEDTIIRLSALYSHYERQGAWTSSIQGLQDNDLATAISIPLLGTVFISIFWGMVGVGPAVQPDPTTIVDHFLLGHGNNTDQKISMLKEMIASLEAQRDADKHAE